HRQRSQAAQLLFQELDVLGAERGEREEAAEQADHEGRAHIVSERARAGDADHERADHIGEHIAVRHGQCAEEKAKQGSSAAEKAYKQHRMRAHAIALSARGGKSMRSWPRNGSPRRTSSRPHMPPFFISIDAPRSPKMCAASVDKCGS